MSIWTTLLICLGINAFGFVLALAGRTDRYTDISYALTFMAVALAALAAGPSPSGYSYILAVMVVVWGLRLGVYLLARILRIGRDDRFDERREHPGRLARFWGLQALSVWIISLPFVLALAATVPERLPARAWAGVALWALGLGVETISDWQKYRFRNRKENRGAFIRSGLWRYSRHPNYFGEILVWWGLWLAALPRLRGWGHLGVMGPVFITLLLLFVSGIPLLEKKAREKYGDDPAWQEYVRSTSILIPWFPRRRG